MYIVSAIVILALLPATQIINFYQPADADLSRLYVGESCFERSGSSAVTQHQCERSPDVCEETAQQVTLQLGVEGGVVVAGINGSVSYTVTMPTGCEGTGVQYEKDGCPQKSGVAFVGSGYWWKTRLVSCPLHDRKVCVEIPGVFNIALPQSVVNALNDLVPGNPIPDDVSIPYPVVFCRGDEGTLFNALCPGTNGDQTYYEVLDENCHNNAGE